MNFFVRKLGWLSVIGMLATSCGMWSKSDNDKNGDADIVNEKGTGCIQGVVLNGLTGERVPLKKGDVGKSGVYVLVRNKMIPATPLISNPDDANANKDLVGEYYLCGFPLDETFPVFAFTDGYQSFEGQISVASTIPQKTQASQQTDITRSHPTLLADIHIYPLGVETNDLKFTVLHKGDVLAGAKVQLKPTGAHVLEKGQVTPQIRKVPMTKSTDAKGEVVFEAKDLVLGGVYQYTIIPPNGGSSALVKTDTVVVGLRDSKLNLTQQPFDVVVSIDESTVAPKIEAKSTDASGYNTEGKVVIWFNQQVELAPSSVDQVKAYVTPTGGATLSDAGNKGSVDISIEGNRMTLKPRWITQPSFKTDPQLAITYSGITVRPKGSTVTQDYKTLDALSVRFYDSY